MAKKSKIRNGQVVWTEDIFASGLANNHTTLARRIREEGFPSGFMVGRRRCWPSWEPIREWVKSRPTENTAPLRGRAKLLARR